MKKLVFLLFGLFLVFADANATHMLGGEIIWECHPTTGKYRFIVRLYRECGGFTANLPNSVSLTGSPITISCPLVQSVDVSPTCGSTGGLSCATTTSAGTGAVQMGIYRSSWVTLNGVPPAAGWTFKWGSCCRPSSISNVTSTTFQERATMYAYNNTNASSCYDNSPDFLESPLILACSGQPTNYNNVGFDEELDSLYYSWATAKQSSGTNVIYKTGYSATSPIPDNNPPFNSNNTGALLNGVTGQMNLTCYDHGSYVTVLKIEEWRNGILIGEIFRDIPIIVRSCTQKSGSCPQVSNNNPTIDVLVDSTTYPNGPWVTPVINSLGILDYYETSVEVGEQINFDILASDLDSNSDCTQQQVTFYGAGGNLALFANPNTCQYGKPCATIQPLNSNGSFTNPVADSIRFQWKTDCPNLTYQQFLSTPKMVNYTFYFSATDNACYINGRNIITYKVNIANPAPKPPTLKNTCVDLVASSGDISFSWTTKTDTTTKFDYYLVYHSVSKTGPYNILDTVFNFSDTTYVDVARGNGKNYYFTRTAGGCSLLSETSDTISLIHLLITPVPFSNPDTALLDWTAHTTNPNTGAVYQISKKILPNGSWNIIDTTQGLTYADPLGTTSFSNVDYKISINGKCFSAKAQGIGLNENILSAVKVSPNPFSEKILVSLPTEINAKALKIKLFEMSGKELKDFEVTLRDSEIEINNVASLPRGVYFLQLSVNGKAKTIKLIH